MPIRVKTAHGIVQFPDGTSQADMAKALSTLGEPSQADIAQGGDTVGEREPDTFWGGVNKSLKEQILGKPGEETPLQGAAHPKTAGDMLNLLIPSELGELGATHLSSSPVSEFASRSGQALKSAVGETKGARGVATLPLRAVQKFKEALPTSMEADSEKFMNRGTPAPPTKLTINGAGPDIIDRGMKPPPPTFDLKPPTAKAPTVNEELMKALEGAMGGEKPTLTTLPPEATTAGEGSMPQFGKSKRPLVNTTSGRPSITPTRQDELLSKFGGTAPADGPTGGGQAVSASGPDVPPASDVMDEPSSSSGADATTKSDAAARPVLSVEELAAKMRRQYGSRDAGAMLFGQSLGPEERAAAVKRLAPGPSQLPLSAEERIQEASRRAAQNTGLRGEDTNGEILKMLVAGLSGGALTHELGQGDGQ